MSTKRKRHMLLNWRQIKCQTKKKNQYIQLAEKCRHSMAIWTLSCIYLYFQIPEDITGTFDRLMKDFTLICTRGAPESRIDLIYDYAKSVQIINKGLKQIGQKEDANTWKTLKDMHEWQQHTRYNTASCKKPSYTHNIEKFKGKWADKADIKLFRDISSCFRPDNTTIIQGDPSHSRFPNDCIVLVRNTEDGYKWRRCTPNGKLTSLKIWHDAQTFKSLGITLTLAPYEAEHIVVAYSHLWSIESWLKLSKLNAKRWTLVGRLDQYPKGRGQIFRDICESGLYTVEYTRHTGAEVVEHCEISDIERIVDKYKVVQVFCKDQELLKKYKFTIDTHRIQLKNPFRIRTIRSTETQRKILYEEEYTTQDGLPSSVINIRNFHGVRPNASIYICGTNETSFDIHVARTQCTHKLFIIGKEPNMFSLERRPPQRVTISWK